MPDKNFSHLPLPLIAVGQPKIKGMGSKDKRTENNKNRIGISVSKKVGNSVVRHHLTRLIRESFRLNEEKFQYNVDIVVVVRVQAKDAEYKDILSSFLHLCRLHRLLKEEMV